MKEIGKHFTIKDDKYGEPTAYLGANIERFQLDDGSYALSMTIKHNAKNLIETISYLLAEDGRELKDTFKQKSHTGPLSVTYAPKLDDTPHSQKSMRLAKTDYWNITMGHRAWTIGYSFDVTVPIS